MLVEGGHLALATNRTVSGSTFEDLYAATLELHTHAGVPMDEGPSPSEAALEAALRRGAPDIGAIWGVADPKGGAGHGGQQFEPPIVRTYGWEQTYDPEEAVTLLSTYSPYLAVPEPGRALLLDGIKDVVVKRFHGSVTRRYLSILAVARRRPAS